MLTEKNLKSLVDHLHSFVILVFRWLASPTLIFSKHFVLKDLKFYEVSRLIDTEASQACLDAHEKHR